MSNIGISIGAENRELLSTLSSSEAALRRFSQSSASSMQGFSQAARQSEDAVTRLYQGMQTAFIGGGIAAGLITLQNGISGVTQALVEAQTSADKLRNTLGFAIGAEAAGQEVAYLKAMTQELGVSYGATTQMYARFAAATKGTVLEGQKTREIFEAVSQASVVMGLSLEESEGMFRALTQMVSKGVIQAEELRGQLGERLPGAFKVFADSMGKSTAELSKMLEAGQVGPENLAGFASFLKSSVAPQVESAAQSMQANINRLGNEWLWFKQAVVNSGVGAAMSDALAGATSALGGAREGIEAATDSGAAMRTAFDAAGIAAVALGGSIASRLVTAINDKVAASSAERAATLASAAANATEAQASANSTAAKLADLRASEASMAATRQRAIEEMKAAAAAAQEAQSLNARQSALVRYTAAQVELNATASRQQALHGQLSQALAQHQTATDNATTATRALDAAQNAASVSGRAMGAVMGALGGPVGIAITAVTLLIGKLISLQSAANDAALAGLSRDRLATASANGVQAEVEDIAAVRGELQKLKRERDQLVVDQKNPGLLGAMFGGDYQSGIANQLNDVTAKIAENEQVLKRYEDATNGVAGAVTNTAAAQSNALEALRRATEGTRTASSIKDDYAKKLATAQAALKNYLATETDATKEAEAQRRFNEYQVELTKSRDAALKGLNKTVSSSAGASRDYARAVDSELASLQAKVQAEAQYAAQLAQHGLAATKMTDGEKEAAKIGYELARAQDAKAQATTKAGRAKIDARIATLQLHQTEAQRLADVQRQNQITKESLELGQKAIDDLQKQADAIRDKTAALAEENAAYGQINPTLAKALAQRKELASQMVMTDGSVMDYERAQRAAEAWALMNGYIGQLMKQDWNKINGAVQEWQRSATEQAKLYEDEARLSGLSALERAKVVAARQVELKLAKQIAEIERAKFSEDPVKDAAQKAKLIADATTAAQTESSAAVAKVVQEDWTRTSEKIEEVLIDALMDGGKSGAEYIEGLFRSMVLRPVLQAIVSPVAGAVTSALGFSGPPTSSGGSGSGLNAINSGYKALTASGNASLAFTDFGTYATNAVRSAGGSLTNAGFETLGSNVTSAANSLSKFSSQITTAANVLSYINAAKTFSEGKYGEAAGQAVGTYFGGPIGATIGGELGKVVDKIFGWGGDDKPRHVYQTGGGDFEDKVSVAGVYGDIGMHDNGSKNIKAADFTETFQAIADLDATIAATLSPDQNSQIKAALNNYVSGKNESTADYMAARMKIMADVIGGGVNELVDQFGGTSDELVGYLLRLTQAQPTIDALAFLGKSLGATEAASLSAALALENMVGGQQNLLALTSSYYSEFYTEAERTAHATQALTEALASIGVDTVPATREAFRDLVDAQDLTTESGRETAAGLLGLHGAFAALVPATEAAANAVDGMVDAVETIEQAYQRLTNVTFTAEQAAEQRIGLEEQLLQLQGNTTELRRRELQAIDASNRGLQRLVWTLEDVQSASALVLDAEKQLADAQAQAQQQQYDTQYEAAKAIADAARTAADEMKSLADTLREFVLGETLTPSELFADTLKKALGGDVEAMRALPQAATAQIDAARNSATTQADYAIARAQTLNAVQAAAAIAGQLGAVSVVDPVRQVAQSTTAKDPVQEALGELNTAIEVLTMSIATALGGDLAENLGKIDTNLDGSVSESEFKAAFSGTASDNVLNKIFNALDSDGSKMITKLEAIKSSTSALVTSFGTFSVNLASALVSQSGSLSTSALSAALGAGKDTAASTKTASALDFDGSGVVTKSEAELAQSVASIAEKYASTASTDYISGASTNASSNTDNSLNSIYKELLGRDVDVSGASYYAGKSIESVIADIKSSPEYAVRNAAGASAQNLLNDLVNSQLGISNSTKAFHTGGYTGPGGKYETAGVVHRGEVVFSQDDIARLGGVRAVEAIRTGEMPGYATGGTVGAPVVVPAPVIPGRVAMAPRPAAAPATDPEQQERDAQARDQAQRDAQQQTQDLIQQLRQVNSNLTELKRSVDKSGQSNDQMNNRLYNTADTTLKLLRKFDALGMPVVQAATEAA